MHCIDHLFCPGYGKRFLSQNRLVAQFNEGGKPSVSEGERAQPGPQEAAPQNLDLNDAENQAKEAQFRNDFQSRLSPAGTYDLPFSNNGVEYRYAIRINNDGTATITKSNESERRESGTTAEHAATASFNRIFANKVVNMPELGRVLAQNANRPALSASAPAQEEKPKGRNTMIEAGVSIPFSGTETTPEGGVNDWARYGAELNVRYVLTDPTKAGYAAVVVPVRFIYESKDTVNPSSADVMSSLDDTFRLATGVGIEGGWQPVDAFTLYGGAAAMAEVGYTDSLGVAGAARNYATLDESGFTVAPVLRATAGVRVAAGPWLAYVSANPEIRIGTGSGASAETKPDVLITGGTGFRW